MRLVRLAALTLCVHLALVQAASGQLRAGAARVDITPDIAALKVPLGGYAARRAKPATGVHDPIYARALVLETGAGKVAIVSVDLCFLPANVTALTLRQAAEAGLTGLSADRLLLCATHSHTSPDPLAMHTGNQFTYPGWTPFSESLLRFTTGRIAAAIVQADKRLRPARISLATSQVAGLNRNRRGDPGVDREMTVLRVSGRDGSPIAAVVDFAAHPTIYDDDMMQVSADWPGAMTSDVEADLGGGAVCLFLNGAEGDASPAGSDGLKPGERVSVYGRRVASAAIRLLHSARLLPAELRLRTWQEQINLPPRKPNGMFFLAAAQFGASIPQAKELVDHLMPVHASLAFLSLGPLLLIGFPCEPSGALGLASEEIAHKAGYKDAAVVALTNGWLAYALTPEQYDAGKYESMMSFYGRSFGERLMEAVKSGCRR